MGCGRPRGCSALKSRWSRLSLCPRLSCECPGKGHRQPSVLCLLYSSLGHICNTVGALLASQLGIQVGKALCGRVGTPLRPAHPLLRPWDSRLPARGAILLSWGAGPGGGRILAAWLKVVWQTAVVGGCELLPEVLHFGEVQPPCAVVVSLPRSSQAPTWPWPMSCASCSPSFPRARLSPVRQQVCAGIPLLAIGAGWRQPAPS